ncbi:hypothetical protein BASA81_010367 [Batrachochytrium salamandrivorans]|nr:hypothetical protein BASA81_010367 [Batrachochytrium salamandrivorans]
MNQSLLVALVAVPVLLNHLWRKASRITNEPGRIAVVTGAAGGVGKETVLQLVEQGWKVYACDVNEAGLVSANFPLQQVTTVAFDVRNEEQCQALVDRVAGENGGALDALLNIAGVVQPGPVCGFSSAQVRFLYEINTFGPIALCGMFVPLLLKGRFGGSIVNLASISAKMAWPWSGSYSSSKAALLSFSDGLRREALANDLPLRVSVVVPGPIITPMISHVPESLKKWATSNPTSPFMFACGAEADFMLKLKQVGFSQDSVSVTPQHVAGVCVGLLDDLYPAATKLVMTLPFTLLYSLCAYLPVVLGDRLLVAM